MRIGKRWARPFVSLALGGCARETPHDATKPPRRTKYTTRESDPTGTKAASPRVASRPRVAQLHLACAMLHFPLFWHVAPCVKASPHVKQPNGPPPTEMHTCVGARQSDDRLHAQW